MTRPSFWHGVVVAAILAVFASAFVAALLPFIGTSTVLRWVIPLLGLGYIAYLLSRSGVKVGIATTLLTWSITSLAIAWFVPTLPLYLLIHVGLIWIVRSLYFYSGVLPALIDLGLSIASVSAMVWAVTRSGSILLATWCFFLIHALFTAIPARIRRTPRSTTHTNPDHFQRARRQADAALRQLFSDNSRTHS
ncbi:MAG: hypothetical protein AAGL69_01080 [Pseudomonadota bacterium]